MILDYKYTCNDLSYIYGESFLLERERKVCFGYKYREGGREGGGEWSRNWIQLSEKYLLLSFAREWRKQKRGQVLFKKKKKGGRDTKRMMRKKRRPFFPSFFLFPPSPAFVPVSFENKLNGKKRNRRLEEIKVSP